MSIASEFIESNKAICVKQVESMRGELSKAERVLFDFAFASGMECSRKYNEILERVFDNG